MTNSNDYYKDYDFIEDNDWGNPRGWNDPQPWDIIGIPEFDEPESFVDDLML